MVEVATVYPVDVLRMRAFLYYILYTSERKEGESGERKKGGRGGGGGEGEGEKGDREVRKEGTLKLIHSNITRALSSTQHSE